jgi:hypothetical protein
MPHSNAGRFLEEVAAAEARVVLAEAQLRMAQVHHRYHEVRAPLSGRVAAVYRHAGDAISLEQLTPILRIIDTERLRIRVEIDEADVPRIRPGMEGSFHVRGVPQEAGRLVVRTLVPQFGPKRLFTPDASARVDTRVLHVLCDVLDARIPLHPGQRITATSQPTRTAARPGGSRARTGGVRRTLRLRNSQECRPVRRAPPPQPVPSGERHRHIWERNGAAPADTLLGGNLRRGACLPSVSSMPQRERKT